MKTKNKAFTLIEISLVIGIIAILSTVVLSVINPSFTQGTARDGVRMSNMQKIAQALESYSLAESKIPKRGTEFNSSGNAVSSTILSDYIIWPLSEGGTSYEYIYSSDNDASVTPSTKFVVKVSTERNKPNSCLKYLSSKGKIYHCKDCTTLPDFDECTDTF